MIVSEGGVYVPKYSNECTHVIVHDLILVRFLSNCFFILTDLAMLCCRSIIGHAAGCHPVLAFFWFSCCCELIFLGFRRWFFY